MEGRGGGWRHQDEVTIVPPVGIATVATNVAPNSGANVTTDASTNVAPNSAPSAVLWGGDHAQLALAGVRGGRDDVPFSSSSEQWGVCSLGRSRCRRACSMMGEGVR
jgi:hypothetical protein